MASKSKKSKQPGYLSTLGTAAPFFLAKSVLGDLPKGGVEKAIELRLGPKKVPLKKGFMKGIQGRGKGRAIGAMSGVVTAPLYLKSLSLLKSKKKSDQKKGVALLSGVTGLYTVQKGVMEGLGEELAGGASRSTALKKALGLGVGRLSYKIPAALLLAKGLTGGTSGKGKKKNDNSLLAAAIGGAGAGTLNRLGDTGIKEVTNKLTSKGYKFGPKTFAKKLVAGGASGAVAGALGGLVLSKAISAANKALKNKKAG